MIKLIVGTKGAGKTKTIVSMANAAGESSNGNVVFVEKGMKLQYDLATSVRLVDTEEYDIVGFEKCYGFLTGILAGNYDITHMFVDGTFKIGGAERDLCGFGKMIDALAAHTEKSNVEIIITVSCDASELPENAKQYIINQ